MNRKVKSQMVLHGITNRYIARKYGVSETWVSLVIHEKGKSRRIKRAIARALKQPIGELWPPEPRRVQGFAQNHKKPQNHALNHHGTGHVGFGVKKAA